MNAVVWAAAIVAGGVGACVRYAVSVWLASPGWAVLLVNVAGSAVAGTILGFSGPAAVVTDPTVGGTDPITWVLLGGFAGGLTTFSTFSVETVTLAENKLPWRAAGFAAANILFGFAAATLAYSVVGLAVG